MKIKIKPIVRSIALEDYAEEYATETIMVWVNPPRQLRLDLFEMTEGYAQVHLEIEKIQEQGEELKEKGESTEDLERQINEDLLPRLDGLLSDLYRWYSKIWSQDIDPETHWTPEEIAELAESCQDNDPGLWDWLQTQTMDALAAHREGRKKKQ